MLDVIIGRHTWNCQIRTHINTEPDDDTHAHAHTKTKNTPKKEAEDVTTIGKPQSLITPVAGSIFGHFPRLIFLKVS